MARVEPADHRGHEHGAAPRPDADPQLAELEALGEADVAVEVAGTGVQRQRVAQDDPAHLGELDPARAAVEERGADLGFQRLDAAGQGRLREVAGGRGPHDRAVLGHGDEVAEPTKVHGYASYAST